MQDQIFINAYKYVDGVFATISYVHENKRRNTNKLADMLSRSQAQKTKILGTLVHMEVFSLESYCK
jgi:hypothetical protein